MCTRNNLSENYRQFGHAFLNRFASPGLLKVYARPKNLKLFYYTPGMCLDGEERVPGTHCTGRCVGRRAGLDTEARRRILSPLPGIKPRSPGRAARSQTLHRPSYPGSPLRDYSGLYHRRLSSSNLKSFWNRDLFLHFGMLYQPRRNFNFE
jgi:hypothetical protein